MVIMYRCITDHTALRGYSSLNACQTMEGPQRGPVWPTVVLVLLAGEVQNENTALLYCPTYTFITSFSTTLTETQHSSWCLETNIKENKQQKKKYCDKLFKLAISRLATIQILFQNSTLRGAWSAHSVEHATFDLGVMSPSPTLVTVVYSKKKKNF